MMKFTCLERVGKRRRGGKVGRLYNCLIRPEAFLPQMPPTMPPNQPYLDMQPP
jgi:hypothetical protein